MVAFTGIGDYGLRIYNLFKNNTLGIGKLGIPQDISVLHKNTMGLSNS